MELIELEYYRGVIQDLINAWDYCNQDPADRGYAVLSDAIEEARTALTNGELS